MYNNSETATSCGCFNLDKYDSTVTGIYELTFQKTGDKSCEDVPVHVKDYTSKSFTKLFLKDGMMPTGVNSAAITQSRQTKVAFRRSVEAVIKYVNNGGSTKRPERKGFTIQGWVRRG